MELFRAIPEDTVMMKIIEIRGKDVPTKGDKKAIRKLKKIKAAYKLESKKADISNIETMKSMMFH